MIDLLKHIKNLSVADNKTLSQKGLKLSEEAGELAKAILPYEGADGCNHRFPDVDKIIEESIDTILVAYSIAHSIIEKYEVGDSDDIIIKMLQKKTKKWQSLVDGEKTDLNKIPFEIHVTLAQTDNIEKFKTDCIAIGVKPIILDLYTSDGGVIKDVMTSSKVVGNSLDAAIETRRISASFKAYGYTVLREKIETAPWHPASINDTRSRLISEKNELERQKEKAKKKVTVADHAVIRYLERRYGFDFEDIRGEILTDAVIQAAKMGAEGIKMHHGTFKIRDNVVVTYVPN